MKINSSKFDMTTFADDSLVVFSTPSALKSNALVKEISAVSNDTIKKIFESGEFEGKLNQTVVIHNIPEITAGRIILAGLGNKALDGFDHYRQSAGTLSKIPAVKKSKSLGFYIDKHDDARAAQAIFEGFTLGGFKVVDYKTGDDGAVDNPDQINFYSHEKKSVRVLEKASLIGQIVAEGVTLARTLTSHPGNVLTPRKFSSEIQALSKKHGFKCKILDEKKIAIEKMGALLSVAKGSKEPPRFAIMEYYGGRQGSKPVVLVGKGITFDAGGISLKPALNMGEMKGDMQGAAVVTGTFVSAVRLNLKVNLVGLIPMAENLPSSKASKPGDIVKSRKGKTIEIINTDAEGRLILADALDYANKFNPQAVVDIATLTGAAQYILGTAGIPIMGNNSNLMDTLRDASVRSAEKVWELPIWDEYHQLMKSPIADLKNSAGKNAGTLAAAAFLEEFIGDWPWGHIDIAAVDVEKNGQPYYPVGVTSIGLKLLVEMLSGWKKLK